MQNIDVMIQDLKKIQSEKNKSVSDVSSDAKRMAEILEYMIKRTVLSQSI